MSVKESPDESESEARRQIEICNACRYCEGYCAVFPDINRQREFSSGSITQLANLCHNCRGCYYACQYTAPHEFNINIPAILADVRINSWERFIAPSHFARCFNQHGVALAACLILAFVFMVYAIQSFAPGTGEGFYSLMSHNLMIAVFVPAFIAPLFIIAMGLRRYWLHTNGRRITISHVKTAIADAASLKNLSGGQGQGCNFEQGDRFSHVRTAMHHFTVLGFLLCFASTSTATVMHYAFQLPAPYNIISVPKLFGLSGGVLLVIGCLGLAILKLKADRSLAAVRIWGGEMAFVLLLAATGLTGLALYAAATADSLMYCWRCI